MSAAVYFMNKILKPCPVCGGKGELAFYSPHGRPPYVIVECWGHNEEPLCFCRTGEHKTMHAAVKAWNRRTGKERIMIDGLKTCPCCGEHPVIRKAYDPDFGIEGYIVICL
ncbi:MAG: Lar family restriction alleviation protein, partial [Synergistaceae bacterium]|nr:Lar family restriction alleviation protein [Synergistaceae bacterium]